MRERGFGWIEIIIALGVLGLASAAVLTYRNAIAGRERAEAQLANVEQALSEQVTENFQARERASHLQLLLTARQSERNALVEAERRLSAKLGELLRDPAVRSWADTPVPDAITRSLRNPANPADSPQGHPRDAPAQPAAAGGSAGLAGGHDELAALGAGADISLDRE